MKIFDSAFGIHEKALDIRSQRLEVLAKNIANSDTPYFKAQDIDFKRALSEAQSSQTLNTTHTGHIAESVPGNSNFRVYTMPFSNSMDGNTVELNVEQAKYGKAAAQYQATLRFLEGNISGIRKALRGD
jgi:flagellar basal-body rod protein FlgB